MPSRISWHLEQRVLFLHYWGNVTVAEMDTTTPQTAEYIRAAGQKVHLIVDISRVTGVPTTNITQLNRSARILFSQPNLGYVIAIFHHKLVSFFAQVVLQMQHNRGKVVNSWAEALTALEKLDVTLPPLDQAMPEENMYQSHRERLT